MDNQSTFASIPGGTHHFKFLAEDEWVQILMMSKEHQHVGNDVHGEACVSIVWAWRQTNIQVPLMAFTLSVGVCENALKLHNRLLQRKLHSPCCFLPIEDISFPCAICLSTLPYQETINRTICGLVTSPVIPPNQIMTNCKKAGWVSQWCSYQGRTSSCSRAQSNTDTVTENTVWLLSHNGSF